MVFKLFLESFDGFSQNADPFFKIPGTRVTQPVVTQFLRLRVIMPLRFNPLFLEGKRTEQIKYNYILHPYNRSTGLLIVRFSKFQWVNSQGIVYFKLNLCICLRQDRPGT